MKKSFALMVVLFCPPSVFALDRDFSTVSVSNTTTDTTIYSFTVPAGTLANSRGVRIQIWGTYSNNHFVLFVAQNHTLRVQLKFGGATVLDRTTIAEAANATTAGFLGSFLIINTSPTTQQLSMTVDRGRNGTRLVPMVREGTSAVDTTADALIEISVQHDAANANLTLVKEGAYAELL